MVRGSNSKANQMGRRSSRPTPSSKTSSEQTPSRQQNESRKSRYLYSDLDNMATPAKQHQSNNTLLANNTTPQIRTSTRLNKGNHSLLKSNSNLTTSTPKQLQANNNGRTGLNSNSTAKSLRTKKTRKKRKGNKWESSSEDEDEFEPTRKRRGAYLEAYQNSSYYDDEENEEEDDETEEDEFDAADDQDSTLDDDNADTTSTNQNNATDNFQWRRAQRPNSPPQFSDENLPEIKLPDSSQDLLLTDEDINEYLMQICSIYEILKHFKNQLRLSSFRIEEFIAALQLDEMNSLCSEIHITLLKVLIKEDEINGTMIGSNEVKDSINIHLYVCDAITWPQVLKMYLLARSKGALLTNSRLNEQSGDQEAKRIVQSIFETCYPIGVELQTKLSVLQYLCDSFLETNIAREEITQIESMTIKHDDHCRKCHKLGDLLCCDNCQAVFHLACIDPPINNIPSSEWICHICKAMNIEEIETATVRKEVLGWDRHGRKYWWLCQRLIVEQDDRSNPEKNKVWYYSTKIQFNDLLNLLDRVKYEKDLVEVLHEMTEEICKGFDQIYQLTQNAITVKGLMLHHVKSWIEICMEEARVREEDQKKLNEAPVNTSNDLPETNVGIVTRTKTGAIHQSSKSFNEDRNTLSSASGKSSDVEDQNILYIWDFEKDDRFLKRMNKKYIPNLSSLIFKLGMEAKTFVNYFNVNILALNKYQQQEERDKKRQLSYKFSFTPASEFKWLGVTNSCNAALINTLRKSLIHFESSLQSPFLHPNWSLSRKNFLAAVNVCRNAKDFALALSILESSIKPVLFNPVWNDSLGHNLLERTTVFDREERKKIEKRERREQAEELDMLMRIGSVKYTLMPQRSKDGVWSGQGVGRGVHQLWKQRGEEYRNVMRALRLDQDKRIYFPKRFNKKACPKLELIEGLLDKRIKLKKALELEKAKMEKLSADTKTSEDQLKLICYSPDCRDLQAQDKQSNLRCYSHDCRKESGDFDDEEKENSDEEKQKEISEVSYCVKPVYLYNVNERNEIQRKLNAKRLLGKGQLPPCSRFVTKSGKKSIFVLPSYELRKLGRSAALREVCGFSYTAKSNSYIWPFHSTPRPLFKTCWSYRNSIIEKDHGLESVALSLRIIWHCIRWDDMANKPLSNTITTETDIITTELLKRRDLAPFGIRSEYLVRKIIVPIEFENEKDDNEWRDTSVRFSDISTSSKREGLRERKKKFDDSELRKQGPSVTETWTAEEELQLWEIRGFGEKLEKQQQMIKEREKERIQKENLERARKLQEERQREERSKKLLSNEKARVSPIIQKTGQIKRVLATQQNNNASNQQSTQGFAMIRTLGGQTYRIPVSALQGKKLGQQIVIKTGNPNSGQFTYTTKATIISTNTQPIATNTPQNSNVTTTNAMQITPHSTVRPLILSSSGNATNLATGISASSLHQQNAATPHKIQFVKQISTPTVSSQPISTVTTSSSASTPLTAVQQPSTVAQPTTTIKILPSALLAANGNANSNNPLQLAIKMPDGRLQLIQLPASMLNSTQPIQIAIPQQTSSASSTPTTNIVSQTTTSTPTNQIMRTIQTSSPSPQIIRAVAPSSNSSPTIIRTVTPNSQVIRTITSTLNQNSTIRTITPVAQPILRTASTTSTNTSIVQKSQPIKSTPAISSTSNNSSAAVSNETTATTIKTLNKRSIAATIENSPVQKPLLQHQLLDDQLNQSDSQIKIEESSFKLTPQYKQEIVKAALSSRTNTPEITQKLLALQKHTQQQANNSDDNRVSNIPPTNQLRRSTAGGLIRNSLNSRNNLTNRHSSQSRILNISNSKCLEEERDDIVVKTIIKAMIDKIEKDEKLEQRRKKARENQLQTKWRQSSIRQNAKLNKNADLLKKEMLKIRAMYQREVKESVKQEINGVLKKMQHETSATTKNRMSGENSQDCPDLQNKERTDSMLQNSNSKTSGNAEFEPPAHNELGPQSKEMAINRAPSSEDCVNSFSSSSKRKSIASIQKNNNNLNNDCSSSIKSSTSSSSTNNLIKSTSTNQTTNNKRKSLTSDQIGNLKRRKLLKSNHLSEHQFHDQFSTMDESGTNKQKRLYCICKQAYDSKRFMIGCDLCHDWFHISCLNLAEDKVKTMSSFICQNCRDTHGSELDDEEFLDEEDDELVLDEEEQLEEDNESNSNQLIISEPSNQQLPKAERLSNCDNSLIDNSKQHNSKDLVQKVSPSSKRKATSNNVDSNYSNKVAVVQQAVNGVKAIRKKQTTTSASKPAAKQAKQEAVEQDNELYCICRTPYNESQFYVQCEKCDEWLHGKCIGLLSKEAEKIDVYLCPTCDHTSTINYANQKELDNEDYEQLRRLLKSIQQHKNAWPFLRPVDERQVPDYYNVIKDPMDLSSIETNLNKHGYSTLTSFIGHITQIFDNCHYYNDAKSSIVSCANNLENFFVQKLSQFRQQMIR